MIAVGASQVRYMTYGEYASRLGAPYGTIKRWVSEGLPVRRMDDVVRVPVALADQWVRSNHPRSIAFDRTSVVYVARASDGAIKIGFSSNLDRRAVELGGDGHGKVEMLASIPGDARMEGALRERFAALRIRGEWFRSDGDLLPFLDFLALSPFAVVRFS